MSASASKKKRKELEKQGTNPESVAAKELREKKKQTTRSVLIFAAIVIVAAIALALLIHGLNAPSYDTGKAVVTVGDQSIPVPVYNYFYNSIVSDYYNSYSYFFKTDTPLSQQNNIFGGTGTLEDYFKETTNSQIKTVLNLYEQAVASGYKLSDEDQKSITDALDALKTEASGYGFSNVDKYLAARFGEGCTRKNYETYLTIYSTYAGYVTKLQQDFAPTAEELKAEYEKDPTAYDVVTFTYATTDVKKEETADDAETGDAEEGESPETTEPVETADPEAAKEAARAEAEAKQEHMDEDTTTVTYSKSSASSMNAELAEWLFDDARVEGETTVIARNEDNTSFYTVRFDKRDDNNYKLVNAYVLTQSNNSEQTDEAQTTALEKFTQFAESITEDMTDEEFEAYASGQNFSASKTRIAKTTYDELISDYLFDESRKAGDFTVLVVGDTAYFLRFAGLDDETYQEAMVKNTLWSNFFQEASGKNEAVVDTDLLKFANTDLTFYSNNSSSSGNAADADALPVGDATPEDAAG